MWNKKSIIVGATGLLSNIANHLPGKAMMYSFWDEACDIPSFFNARTADNMKKNPGSIQVQGVPSQQLVLHTSVGGGGTNVYSVVDRLSPYVYPNETDSNGVMLPPSQRTKKYSPDMKSKYKLTYENDYDLIIIYSDFEFYGDGRIPSDLDSIKRRFAPINLKKLCCICCSQRGESDTPVIFKKSIRYWVPFTMWQKEIEAYAIKDLYGH